MLMRANKNTVLIEVEEEKSTTMNIAGKEMFLDSRFEEGIEHTRVFGNIKDIGPVHGSDKGGLIDYHYSGSPAVQGCDQITYQVQEYSLPIEKGDRVYYHFNIMRSGANFIKEENGKRIYWCAISQLICYIKDGKVIPVLGNILVRPFYSKDVEEIELTHNNRTWKIKGIIDSETGLIKEVGDKPKYLHGIVAHRCSKEDPLYVEVEEGDHILYTTDSEWENTIEGVLYYTMKQVDAFAKVVGDDILPVGEYVKILPDLPDTSNESLFLPEKYKHGLCIDGTVIAIGSGCTEVEVGDKVHFVHRGPLTMKVEGLNEWYVKYQDIFMKYE